MKGHDPHDLSSTGELGNSCWECKDRKPTCCVDGGTDGKPGIDVVSGRLAPWKAEHRETALEVAFGS